MQQLGKVGDYREINTKKINTVWASRREFKCENISTYSYQRGLKG